MDKNTLANIGDLSPYRILIVEDELKLLEHLAQIMREEGHSPFTCQSYRELESILVVPTKRFEIVILDRLLHGRDSADLIEKIKTDLPDTKIIILSAINSVSEKASLLDKGADDYMAKPFSSEELAARIRALLRRSEPSLTFGNIVLNSHDRTMKVGTLEVPLPNKEFVLLRTLISNPGKIYGKVFLYEKVWEMSAEVESNAVETMVNKLRRRLIDAGATVHIKNSRNAGYWIEE